MDGIWNEYEYAHLQQMLTCTFIGSKTTVDTQLRQFIDVTAVDEIIVTANVYDQDARLKSYELLRGLFA
jgi:alkanesulfonate monooxygenase SsuD/methylene tetrahydromethanopterin reductase-like flavin-dependent oxidoreductase (luciferase family)